VIEVRDEAAAQRAIEAEAAADAEPEPDRSYEGVEYLAEDDATGIVGGQLVQGSEGGPPTPGFASPRPMAGAGSVSSSSPSCEWCRQARRGRASARADPATGGWRRRPRRPRAWGAHGVRRGPWARDARRGAERRGRGPPRRRGIWPFPGRVPCRTSARAAGCPHFRATPKGCRSPRPACLSPSSSRSRASASWWHSGSRRQPPPSGRGAVRVKPAGDDRLGDVVEGVQVRRRALCTPSRG